MDLLLHGNKSPATAIQHLWTKTDRPAAPLELEFWWRTVLRGSGKKQHALALARGWCRRGGGRSGQGGVCAEAEEGRNWALTSWFPASLNPSPKSTQTGASKIVRGSGGFLASMGIGVP